MKKGKEDWEGEGVGEEGGGGEEEGEGGGEEEVAPGSLAAQAAQIESVVKAPAAGNPVLNSKEVRRWC